MTLQDNLDLYDVAITKNRIEAFKRANNTITDIYINKNITFFFVEIEFKKNKVKDFETG